MIKVNMINVFFMQISRFLHLLQGISGLLRGSERVNSFVRIFTKIFPRKQSSIHINKQSGIACIHADVFRSREQISFNALNPRLHAAADTGKVLMIFRHLSYSTTFAPVVACQKASTVDTGLRSKILVRSLSSLSP